MGIPGVFKMLVDRYGNTLYWDSNYQCDYLYLDYNSLIHGVKAKFFSYSNPKINKILEMTETKQINEFIKEIIKYTQFVFDTVKPKKLFYIAIDGPVPYAKMHLQRLRRYIKVKDQKYISNIKKSYNIDENELFDSNLITPGTNFMKKFEKEMTKYIKGKKFGKYDDNIEIIFDDSSKPGEGESKSLKHLKSLNLESDDKICLYGKDADLIMLMLSVNINNINILREPDIYSKAEQNYQDNDFILFSIDNLKTALITEYKLENLNYDNFIKDFTFLTLLVGNDFVKKIPFLQLGNNLSRNGWYILLNIYIRIINNNGFNYLLIINNNNSKGNKININITFFTEILKELSKLENNGLINIQQHHDRYRYQIRESEEYKQKIELYTHSPYTDNRNPFHSKYINEMNIINYHNNNWKQKYYEHFFKGVDVYNHQQFNELRRIISIHYIESLIWTINYYLDDILSWHFYYQFRVAPHVSDLLYNLKYITDINSFEFKLEKPFTPLEQLFFVLPSQNNSYLPKTYSKLMIDKKSPLIQYFPIDYDLDVVYGHVHYKSNPLLPLFNIKKTLRILKKQKLTKTEQERNTINNNYFSFSY